jgi:hypothetical protein
MSILAAIGNFISDVSKRALGTFFGNTATKAAENKKSSEKIAPSTALIVQQDSRMVQASVASVASVGCVRRVLLRRNAPSGKILSRLFSRWFARKNGALRYR